MSHLQSWMVPEHLAPGDSKSLAGDWSEIQLHDIRSSNDPRFDMAFGALWAEFGMIGEMEQAAVLARRLLWNPLNPLDGASLRYSLVLLTCREKFVAVRDHTVIVLPDRPGAVVHMSHNLVAPEWRRTGIAGWMRALPVSTARDVLRILGRPGDSPVTLLGEMEHLDANRPATRVRLTAYEKAGFKMVDPSRIHYLQPDFRDPSEIDQSSGPQPVPLCLMLRRVGLEAEDRISGAEVLAVARSLYKMYGIEFRAWEMQGVLESLKSYPAEGEWIDLIAPTSA
jgi:hypothetical protein